MTGRIGARLEKVERAVCSRPLHLIVCENMAEVAEAKRFLGDRFGDLIFVATGVRHGRTETERRGEWLLGEKLLQDDADAIVRAVVEAAKGGDPTAMRLCVERLIPVRKGRPIEFNLPPVETAADITTALGVIAKAMAAGVLTPDEAGTVASVIETQRRAIETVDIDERLRKVEKAQAGGSK